MTRKKRLDAGRAILIDVRLPHEHALEQIEGQASDLHLRTLPQSKQREARANQLDVRVPPDALSRARSTDGGSRPATLADAQAHPADRGQGAKKAEAPESIKLTEELPQ
jgi:hypothetical protein